MVCGGSVKCVLPHGTEGDVENIRNLPLVSGVSRNERRVGVRRLVGQASRDADAVVDNWKKSLVSPRK